MSMQSLEFVDGLLNVDIQTRGGLARARENNLVGEGLADVFATSRFFEGALLFNPGLRGRAFVMLRHPVRRAEAIYQALNPRGPDLAGFRDYLRSEKYNDNWVVRSLLNDKRGALSEERLEVAKGILAGKFLVGVAEYFEETVKRFVMYYDLQDAAASRGRGGCVEKYLGEDPAGAIERGSFEWGLVADRDQYDMMLYYYALEVFAKQASTHFNRPYVDKTGTPIDFAELKKKRLAGVVMDKMLNALGM